MISINIPTQTLFLLDRNVVSVIKDEVAGRKQKGENEQRMLESLKEKDAPQYAFSPLVSLTEGEHGREDGRAEKIKQLEKETAVVARFFSFARTDSMFLTFAKYAFAQIFAGLQEASWEAQAAYRTKAASVISNPVAPALRRYAEDRLIELARSEGLEKTNPVVALSIACLYGNRNARKVLKPTKPDAAYNVLSDLQIIAWIASVKAVARTMSAELEVCFLTLDGGLEQVLNNIRVVESQLNGDAGVQARLDYLPLLFTELGEDDAKDLINRLYTPS
ncbi:hypothetical protein JOE11_004896 [Robbsia andropogonis]|uniref:hypothetical protein n=1 Tax=Robbsia andropogonis TaxID=28092 RepID=UPI003D195536